MFELVQEIGLLHPPLGLRTSILSQQGRIGKYASGGGRGVGPSEENEMTYVGIDVSKASLDVATIAVTGEVKRAKFENTAQGHEALLSWLGHLSEGFEKPLLTLRLGSRCCCFAT